MPGWGGWVVRARITGGGDGGSARGARGAGDREGARGFGQPELDGEDRGWGGQNGENGGRGGTEAPEEAGERGMRRALVEKAARGRRISE